MLHTRFILQKNGNKNVFIIMFLAFALTGCSQDWIYTPPTDLTSQTAATIKGSDDTAAASNVGALQVYLVDIDGKDVVGGWGNPNSYKLGWQPWKGVYLLSPGSHDIKIGVQCCTQSQFNFVDVTLNFTAGATYILRATTPEIQSDGSVNTSVLVENEQGLPLSANIPVNLKINPTATPIFVPIIVK